MVRLSVEIRVVLDVPLPQKGYWAKLAAKKTIPKPALDATTNTRAM